jgi:hypothetical protein
MSGADVGGWGFGSNHGWVRKSSHAHGIAGVTSKKQVAAFTQACRACSIRGAGYHAVVLAS